MKQISKVLVWSILLILGLGIVFAPRSSVAASALEQASFRPGELIELRLDPNANPFHIPVPANFSARRAPTATFSINYLPAGAGLWGDTCVAWSPQAQTAFTYAANIWASLLVSTVPITIDACWSNNLGVNILGHGGAQGFYRNFSGAPQIDTWYPVALVNKYYGSDYVPGTSDIYIAYNSAASWYYNTDGNTSPGTTDLVTVVLHEMAHGLGFTGFMRIDDGTGTAECNGTSGYGCWGLGTGYPSIYDRFTQDASGFGLIDTSHYANPSTALGNALKSGAVYFSGSNANAANGGTRVPLYAPGTWSSGSSYAHLAESFNGTPNALMTYSLAPQESIHDPGPVTTGIMRDIGWQFTLPTCYTLTTAVAPGGSGSVNANPTPNCNGNTQYTAGTVVTLTANPNAGYAFSSWNGDASGSTNPTTVTMNANKNVTANFLQCYTLTTAVAPGGSGNVNANPTPTCNGNTQYVSSTVVTLTANPNIGYNFGNWSGSITSITNPITVTMSGAKSVTANFTVSGTCYTLTTSVAPVGSGGVSTNPTPNCNGNTQYNTGTVVTLTATANLGYNFGNWSGGATGSINPTTVNMNSAQSVTANYVVVPIVWQYFYLPFIKK